MVSNTIIRAINILIFYHFFQVISMSHKIAEMRLEAFYIVDVLIWIQISIFDQKASKPLGVKQTFTNFLLGSPCLIYASHIFDRL